MFRRFPYRSLGILLFVGAWWAGVPRAAGVFTPYASQTLPHRAAADFDADGLPDVAAIQEGRGNSRISVTLSGSRDAITFEVNVVSVAARDIDHDGDVDIVAATASNQVVIWRNDGHGHFTQDPPLRAQNLRAETAIAGAARDEPVAVGTKTSQWMIPRRRPQMALEATQIRRPTDARPVAVRVLSLSSPRAPPFVSPLN